MTGDVIAALVLSYVMVGVFWTGYVVTMACWCIYITRDPAWESERQTTLNQWVRMVIVAVLFWPIVMSLGAHR